MNVTTELVSVEAHGPHAQTRGLGCGGAYKEKVGEAAGQARVCQLRKQVRGRNL